MSRKIMPVREIPLQKTVTDLRPQLFTSTFWLSDGTLAPGDIEDIKMFCLSFRYDIFLKNFFIRTFIRIDNHINILIQPISLLCANIKMHFLLTRTKQRYWEIHEPIIRQRALWWLHASHGLNSSNNLLYLNLCHVTYKLEISFNYQLELTMKHKWGQLWMKYL